MALLTFTKNFIDSRIVHKINNMKNKTETTYVKMCTTCLQQENGITHKLIEYVLGVILDIGF